ncbi:MAG: hypothetical protein EAY75_15675 [Bacteroidetes bacterium]|nr:MAG: hypothetical protein EAY75_15675 [Bacteroidota bacterium]
MGYSYANFIGLYNSKFLAVLKLFLKIKTEQFKIKMVLPKHVVIFFATNNDKKLNYNLNLK